MKKLQAVDLFCGAGGTTTGAEASGCVDVVLAVNHWHTAIQTHRENHPQIRHICARIENIDVRNDTTLPPIDLILASPECTHHSIARGGRPVNDQTRQQPFALLDWIDAKRPKWVVVENVREFRDWGPCRNSGTRANPQWRPDPKHKGETFRAWTRSIESLGYQVDCQVLNAADFGAATKRNRLFVVARRGNSKRDIPWPEATHAGCWRPAYEVIDWSRPCPSIFGRKRPLAEKTLRRIEIGLRKFCGEAFVAQFRNNMAASGIGDPLSTITTAGAHHGLVLPFQFKMVGRNPGVSRSIAEPIPTIVAATSNHSIIVPYLVPHFGERDGQAPRCHSIHVPAPTKTGHSIVLPFLTKYNGTGGAQPIDEPVDTIPTKDRFGLAMASLIQTMRELKVIDIGFRMLEPGELAAAQGFPADYQIFGSKAEQVRQIGNAVCPPVAEAICRAIGGNAA